MNETVIKPASTRNGQMVKIRCRNNGGVFEVPIGSTVEDAYTLRKILLLRNMVVKENHGLKNKCLFLLRN